MTRRAAYATAGGALVLGLSIVRGAEAQEALPTPPATPPTTSTGPTPSPSAPPTDASGTPSVSPAPAPPPGSHWVLVQDAPPPPSPPGPPVPSERRPVYLHLNTWDLNLEGAFGRFFADAPTLTGFGRVRAGALFIREPLYLALGLTYEYSNLEKATFGVQGEVLHLDSGFWAQAGAQLDTDGHPGGMLSAGWSLFGVEAQLREYDGRGTGVALYGKLRIPVSIIARVFASHPSNAPASPPPQ